MQGIHRRVVLGMLTAGIIIATLVAALFFPQVRIQSNPRQLDLGDTWTYKVTFPDSKSYITTATVQAISKLNRTEVYVLLRDDTEHISTEYLWISFNWHQLKSFIPHIGNMEANITSTYTPPLALFRIPFHVGDEWNVNSTAVTVTSIDNESIYQSGVLNETRATESVDSISTPAGKFETFRVVVYANHTLSEVLWFSPILGQVVRGDYYNDNETVTQVLVEYGHAPQSSTVREPEAPLKAIFCTLRVRATRYENLSQVISTSNQATSRRELNPSFE
jgi:hypothetical protein